MMLFPAFILLICTLCSAQDDGKYRPPTTTTTIRPFPRYSPYRPYDPFNLNRSSNDGRYVGQNDGRYKGKNDGRYRGGNDGRYVPANDGRYVHVDNKYQHIEGPAGSGVSNQGPSGPGYQGYKGSGNQASLGAGGTGNQGSSGTGTQGLTDSNGQKPAGGEGNSALQTTVPPPPPTPRAKPPTPVPTLARQAQARISNTVNPDGWKIIRLENNVRGNGYNYIFETQNGINAEESGRIESDAQGGSGLRSKGFYEYVGDDGQLYRVDYVADSNGFLPQGDHIPKVPPAIEKLLKYLANQPN
ncbi:larval cuticle protein LCP-30 [Toxorhynchites rutilus septentrionalis]|uniref:larval cuticle protein LCP-30 n=1 Tax=Toxorhynchites rutilus septentrionalis TaxID=329112 RepID=UPI00247A5E38|nr:larval cuticle protein LCP-30 [Toxorhynchites rutilus septentrionalis]